MTQINNVLGIEVRKRLKDISDIKADSDKSLKRSFEAELKADEATHRSDITKKQLEEALKEGDQPVEMQTLRVDPITGEVYDTAPDRFEANQRESAVKEVESTGYGVLNGLKVSSRPTPNMTVNVVGGTVHMPDGRRFTLSSPTILNIPDSDSTDRTDIVFVDKIGQLSYVKGTDSLVPESPNGSVLLAEIRVGAGVNYVVGRDVIDKRIIKKNNVDLYNRLVKFKNFANSDGAVTNLINTGLTYTGIDDFIYGNSRTLFNDDATKINGKWQIDCSAFIQACLEGISFANSKYQNEENVRQDSPFLFPEDAKSDTDGRMLANDLAEYAYENGWMYEPLEDYSNVRVGDLIFWHNSPQPHFKDAIGHVQIVINTSREGVITVLHSYENAEKAVQQNDYTFEQLRKNRAFSCARYPLKDSGTAQTLINTKAKEYMSTSSQLLKPLEFVEPLQEQQMYTVFIKASPNNHDAYPLIRLLNDKTIYSFWDKNRKPDGTYKSSFYIPKGTLDAISLQRANLLLANHPGGTVEYFGMYKGYITEFNELANIDVTERGMNENGEYTKYADGTLICTQIKTYPDLLPNIPTGASFKSEIKEWAYPHRFIKTPYVRPGTVFAEREATTTNTPTVGSCKFCLTSTISSNDPGAVMLYAYGEWK